MTDKKLERRGLGRGLSALMADISLDQSASADRVPRMAEQMVAVERIAPNPKQPRRDFDAEALRDLADSIRQKGVIQPLVVRRKGSDAFELVAGERRWRAAQMAGIHEVPMVLRDYDDAEMLEVAIIENIQRADLNSIEEALGYRQLMDVFGHTQEKLAEALSKSRSHIANMLRLLNLPEEVQIMVRDGRLTAGHARALVTSPDPVGMARQVAMRGLNVRETEKMVKGVSSPEKERAPRSGSPRMDADTAALAADLSATLGMLVTIQHPAGSDGGSVTIRYPSLDALDALCGLLSSFDRSQG